MLMGFGDGLALPYDVPANEFLNLQGEQLSTSRNWAVWVPDYLESYAPDPLRYVLSATMPETSDSDFTWRDYVRRNNNELVGDVREPRPPRAHLPAAELRRRGAAGEPGRARPGAAGQGRKRARRGPGPTLGVPVSGRAGGSDGPGAGGEPVPGRAGSVAHCARKPCRHAADARRRALGDRDAEGAPLSIPAVLGAGVCTGCLGFDGDVQETGWRTVPPAAGSTLPPPAPLFAKLDEDEVVEREARRLG